MTKRLDPDEVAAALGAERMSPEDTEKYRAMLPLSMPRVLIYQEIEEERDRQDAQWGGPDHDDQHDPAYWSDIIAVFAQGACNTRVAGGQTIRDPADNYREKLVKAAALAVAAVESCDRKAAKR